MAVADITIFVIVALTINYLLVYKNNKFIGNLLFMVIGLATFMHLGDGEKWIGLILFVMATISLIYDTTGKLYRMK